MTENPAGSRHKRRWRTSVEVRHLDRAHRLDMTSAEMRLWEHRCGKQLSGLRFHRQIVAGLTLKTWRSFTSYCFASANISRQ